MFRKPLAIFLICLAFTLLLGIFFSVSKEKRQNSPVSASQTLLAYQLRSQGQLTESTALFRSLAYNREVIANLLFNAYLDRDDDQLQKYIAEAKQQHPDDLWVLFFEGHLNNWEGNWQEAARKWKESEKKSFYSKEMQKAFENIFPPTWTPYTIARIYLEEGFPEKARKYLLNAQRVATNKELEQIWALMAETYFSEANQHPLLGSHPIYKKGILYLKRIPITEKGRRIADGLTKALTKHILELINNNSLQHVDEYVNVLVEFRAHKEIESVAKRFYQMLAASPSSHLAKNYTTLFKTLQRGLKNEKLKNEIWNQLQQNLTQSIDRGDYESFLDYHAAIAKMYANQSHLRNHLKSKARKKILDQPFSPELLKGRLQIWESLNPTKIERSALSRELVNKGIEKRHLESRFLFDHALAIDPGEKSKTEKIIANAISLRFEKALEDLDNVELQNLTSIAQELGLEIHLKFNDNQLNRIEKMLAVENREPLNLYLDWVLRQDPSEKEALILRGQLAYLQADYQSAKKNFKGISDTYNSLQEPHIVSELLTSRSEILPSLFQKVDGVVPLSDDAYLRLGLGFLHQQNPKQAIFWLQRIQRPSQEAYIANAYALYKLKRWEAAYRELQQLKPPYNRLWGVQAMALEILNRIDKPEFAQPFLENVANDNLGSPILSPQFLLFKERNLDPLQRYAVAARFVKTRENSPERALEFYKKADDLNSLQKLDRGNLYLSLDRTQEGLADFEQVAFETKDPEVRALAYALLAKSYKNLSEPLNALNWYRKAFSEGKSPYLDQLSYVNLLQKLRLWKESKKLSTTDQKAHFVTLFHLNEWIKIREDYFSLSISNKLKLAPFIIAVGGDFQIPSLSKLSNEELIGLCQYYLYRGEDKALNQLLSTAEKQLAQTSEGLLFLADVARRQDQPVEQWLEKAIALDPENLSVLEKLCVLGYAPKSLKAQAIGLASNITTQAFQPDLYLKFCLSIIPIIRSEHQKYGELFTNQNTLHRLTYCLNKLEKHFPNIPLIDLLSGYRLEASGDKKRALKKYQEAIAKDPSYVAALKAAASIAPPLEARSYLTKWVHYRPYDGIAWSHLAKLDKTQGNTDQMIPHLSNANRHLPNHFSNHFTLGKLYLQFNNPESAKIPLERAVQLEPENEEALSLLLRSLLDPLVELTSPHPGALKKEQKEAYRKLHQLNPQKAKELLVELSIDLDKSL